MSRLQQLGSTFDPASVVPGYFRLTPYGDSAADQASFERSDGAHERIYAWIMSSSAALLYVTGRSGCGKSSCLHAYVIPKLEEEGVAVLYVRGYTDPLAALQDRLLQEAMIDDVSEADTLMLLEQASHRLAEQRLLVVFDQFEEFLIIHQEDKAKLSAVNDLLASLQQAPVDGVTLLLVLRTDYIRSLTELEACVLESGRNWEEVRSFNLAESRRFLRGSGLGINEEVEERVIRQLSEIEETKGFIRPVSLNMMGQMLTQMDEGLSRRLQGQRVWAPDLLSTYLSDILQGREFSDAPMILRRMITRAGTKQPASLEQLSEYTGLETNQLRGGLALLQQRSLVRPLDKERINLRSDRGCLKAPVLVNVLLV